MIPLSHDHHRYHSAHKRFLKPQIENFFATEFPNLFGPNIRNTVADKLLEIFYANHKNTNQLKPGQILWNAVHKNTRADSHKMRLVPVVLTIVNEDDISRLEKGMKVPEAREHVIARITQEAYAQGALLSMRDIGLILTLDPSHLSHQRKKYEQIHSKLLPHTGNMQDVGTCITHKYQIIYKSVVEKKDPPVIASETNHSIRAVDNYLKDFNRVKILYLDNKEPEYIKIVTNLPLHVINQYIDIINQYVKEQKVS